MRKNLHDRNQSLRILAGIGLSTLGGMLFAFAFPPFDLWPLIFVGLVPVILSQHRVMPEKFSGAAYGIGVGVYFTLYFAGIFHGGPLLMRWLPLLIAVPSFDWGNIADKHYTHLVFRAVENRTAMVKADIGFDSALIDPRGRVLKKEVSREAQSRVLVADLPAGPEQTPIRHLGDGFGWLCLGGMVLFTLYDRKDLLSGESSSEDE